MTGSSLSKIFVFVCLAYLCAPPAFAAVSPPPAYADDSEKAVNESEIPIQFAAIIVNGRKLIGPSSRARRRSGLTMIPISIVARALGDTASIDAAVRAVKVQRQNGEVSDFDARLGVVRENGLTVLVVSSAGEIIFSPSADELYLPAEIAATLFNASISYNADDNTVNITRGQAQINPAASQNSHRFADIYQVDYDLRLNRDSSASSRNLTLTAIGRLADGRFHFTSNSDGATGRPISIRNGTFNFERPNGQRFTGGDFGAGSNLQFLSTNVRGGSASIPVGEAVITAFAGRSFSGVYAPVSEPTSQDERQISLRNRFRYDTNIFGFYATTLNSLSRKASPLTFSAGAMRFSGSERSGDLISGSVNYDAKRVSLQGDFAFGKFKGLRPDNSRFSGLAAAVDVAGTFNVTGSLALQARYTRIGTNFLSPQQGFREPVDRKAAGLLWSPTKWFSTSFQASTTKHLGAAGQNNNFVTAAFAITPGAGLPRLFVSHTESRTGSAGATAFTLVNASKEFRRLRLFLNATRIKSLGPASINANVSAGYMINDKHSVELSQGIGSGKSYNGHFDWRTSNLLKQRLSLSAGVGYNYGATSGFSKFERLSASVNLPRQTSLQVNYYQTSAGPMLLVSLKGSLFRRREASAFLDSPVSKMNSYGKISGRVYQDINLNGRFDADVDKPQSDVKVRVDGNRYVVSDENGLYKFDSVIAGDHKVYLDLLSVRADLTLLGGAAQDTKLLPGSSSVYDFRLVRTGRMSGRVWLDRNNDGKFDDGESPLADIRIVTASGRDTLTDADGYFTIADLAPGEHVVLIDEKTLPEKVVTRGKPLAVHIFAGRETSEIFLAVIDQPSEVKRFVSAK